MTLETDGSLSGKNASSGVVPGGNSLAIGPFNGPAHVDSSGKGKTPVDTSLISTYGSTFWNTNPGVGNPNTASTPSDNHVQKTGKGSKLVKKQQGADPDNPTAATQDKSMNIHDATLTADPSNISGAIQNALHGDRKSTRLNSSHIPLSRMPSSA